MSAAYSTASNGHARHDDDNVLRPRPRKPFHAQVSQLARLSSSEADGLVTAAQENGVTSGLTRYTMLPPSELLEYVFANRNA